MFASKFFILVLNLIPKTDQVDTLFFSGGEEQKYYRGKDGPLPDLVVFGVGNRNSIPLPNFIRSAKLHGLNPKLVDICKGPADLLKKEIERIRYEKPEQEPLVLVVRSGSSIFVGDSQEIVSQFQRIGSSRILCLDSEKDFGDGFIGYASAIHEIIERNHIVVDLDGNLKFNSTFGLLHSDTQSRIFQSVSESIRTIGSCESNPTKFWKKENEFPLRTGILNLFPTSRGVPKIFNSLSKTFPLVLISRKDPFSRTTFNFYGNYLARNWSIEAVSNACVSTPPPLPGSNLSEKWPIVLMGLFLTRPVPFLERFFEKILAIDYPKDRLHVLLYNGSGYKENSKSVQQFANEASGYASFKIIQSASKGSWEARNYAIGRALKHGIDFYLNVDVDAHLDSPALLECLIAQNLSVVSPLMVVPYRTASNYWGGLNKWGRKSRARNYMDVVQYRHRGLWNVPCVSLVYLLNVRSVPNPGLLLHFTRENDKIYCSRPDSRSPSLEWPFYLTNAEHLGHRISSNYFNTKRPHPELYQVLQNRFDWEISYLHPNWKTALTQSGPVEEPCPDVFRFPLVTENFCREMIETSERQGKWNIGTNYNGSSPTEEHPNPDPYPTVDVDFESIGFVDHWLRIVEDYVSPLRRKVFSDFVLDPPFIDTTIVIRYRPEEQSSNKPHHDTSTYTINLALNSPGKDFEGGGCRFLRHNYSITDSRVGWMLMHPGELTHFHEGMSTTRGTRYILVSFIDPRIKDMDERHPLSEGDEE